MTSGWTSILRYSAAEIQNLIAQSSLVRPITERLLRSAGIISGMRVLDLSCGVGDASFLAAELVGPVGTVVGIDPRCDLVAVARGRAGENRLTRVTFKSVPLAALSVSASFDAVIGRYVSVHQPDLTGQLRMAARLARGGAVVALHEGEPPSAPSNRSVSFAPVWGVVGPTLATAWRETATSFEAAMKLMAHFADAGLPLYGAFCEVPVGRGEDRAAPWMGEFGYVTDGVVPIDTIDRRLSAANAEARRRLERRAQICVWARTPC